jgi:hypothetical protein
VFPLFIIKKQKDGKQIKTVHRKLH